MRRVKARSRRGRRWGPERPRRSTSPEVGGWMPMMVRPRVDLPQPDSPTRPKVSPRAMARSTPRTALRVRPPTSKLLRSARVSRIGLMRHLPEAQPAPAWAGARRPTWAARPAFADTREGTARGRCGCASGGRKPGRARLHGLGVGAAPRHVIDGTALAARKAARGASASGWCSQQAVRLPATGV